MEPEIQRPLMSKGLLEGEYDDDALKVEEEDDESMHLLPNQSEEQRRVQGFDARRWQSFAEQRRNSVRREWRDKWFAVAFLCGAALMALTMLFALVYGNTYRLRAGGAGMRYSAAMQSYDWLSRQASLALGSGSAGLAVLLITLAVSTLVAVLMLFAMSQTRIASGSVWAVVVAAEAALGLTSLWLLRVAVASGGGWVSTALALAMSAGAAAVACILGARLQRLQAELDFVARILVEVCDGLAQVPSILSVTAISSVAFASLAGLYFWCLLLLVSVRDSADPASMSAGAALLLWPYLLMGAWTCLVVAGAGHVVVASSLGDWHAKRCESQAAGRGDQVDQLVRDGAYDAMAKALTVSLGPVALGSALILAGQVYQLLAGVCRGIDAVANGNACVQRVWGVLGKAASCLRDMSGIGNTALSEFTKAAFVIVGMHDEKFVPAGRKVMSLIQASPGVPFSDLLAETVLWLWRLCGVTLATLISALLTPSTSVSLLSVGVVGLVAAMIFEIVGRVLSAAWQTLLVCYAVEQQLMKQCGQGTLGQHGIGGRASEGSNKALHQAVSDRIALIERQGGPFEMEQGVASSFTRPGMPGGGFMASFGGAAPNDYYSETSTDPEPPIDASLTDSTRLLQSENIHLGGASAGPRLGDDEV